MQQAVLLDTIDAYSKNLQLTINRYNGAWHRSPILLWPKLSWRARRPRVQILRIARAQFEHAIAVLTGQPPDSLTIALADCRSASANSCGGSPHSFSSDVLTSLRMNAQVAAANANIGIAITAYYPTLTLSAGPGLLSTNLANLFTYASRDWSVGPTLSETLFDFGRRRARWSAPKQHTMQRLPLTARLFFPPFRKWRTILQVCATLRRIGAAARSRRGLPAGAES